MVNGADSIYVERAGKIYPVGAHFSNEAHLRRVIDKIVGRVGPHRRGEPARRRPTARRVPCQRGHRTRRPRRRRAHHPEVLRGPLHGCRPHRLRHDVARGARLPQGLRHRPAQHHHLRRYRLREDDDAQRHLLLPPEDERIITIEDAAEPSCTRTVLRLESRPANIEGRGLIAIRDLVKNALRMRPDRIVVGEVRDGAALDMLQAMNTGHDGSITTVHANSPRDSLSRPRPWCSWRASVPVRAIREQVAGALDLIIQQARLKDGSRRHHRHLRGRRHGGRGHHLQDIFTFDFSAGRDEHGRFRGQLVSTGLRPKFTQDLSDQGVELHLSLFTFGAR